VRVRSEDSELRNRASGPVVSAELLPSQIAKPTLVRNASDDFARMFERLTQNPSPPVERVARTWLMRERDALWTSQRQRQRAVQAAERSHYFGITRRYALREE
jgi:hypothetical protein